MGRYYSGDIEGKFWFGVQDSDDASFFGGSEGEPNFIYYHFEEGDLDDIEAGIASCRKALGENKAKLDAFFGQSRGYTDSEVANALGFPPPKNGKFYQSGIEGNPVDDTLRWYARLQLGEKILACVKKHGQCDFEAEC